MRQEDRNYYADRGKFIVRKSDEKIMGEDICLGIHDDIDNYKEVAYTKEEYIAFYESIGMEPPYDDEEFNGEEELL